MLKTALTAALLLAMSAPLQASPVKLGPDAVLSGGDYSTGGGLTVALEPRAIDGKLGLCGVWAQSTNMPVYTRRAASGVLTKGIVMIDGQVVTRNLNFLNRVRPSESYAGAAAGCAVLNRAWSPDTAARVTVRIPRHKIIATSEPRRQNGPRVFFTRSDSANPALTKGSLVPSYITSPSTGGTQY